MLSTNFIHILSLNETRLDSTISDDEVSIQGYSILRNDRDRNGGGVALFIHELLHYSFLDVENTFDVEAVSAKIIFGCKHLAITTIYRPPSADVHHLNKKILYMDKVEALATNVVFVGDFNLDVLKLGGNLNKVSDLCINLQLYQMVKSPTTVSFRLARNNVFCHNFVNNWNFFLKKVSYERTHGDLSQKRAILLKSAYLQKILAIFQFLMGATIH